MPFLARSTAHEASFPAASAVAAPELPPCGGTSNASISYRLSAETIWPAQIRDCRAAIRWIRAHAPEHGIDPDRIAVWGTSAGGHLAAMLGVSHGVERLEGE